MNRKLVWQFKKRWDDVNNIEVKELHAAPYSQHFRQLTAAIQLARSLHIADKSNIDDKQIRMARKRWVMLKTHGVL